MQRIRLSEKKHGLRGMVPCIFRTPVTQWALALIKETSGWTKFFFFFGLPEDIENCHSEDAGTKLDFQTGMRGGLLRWIRIYLNGCEYMSDVPFQKR